MEKKKSQSFFGRQTFMKKAAIVFTVVSVLLILVIGFQLGFFWHVFQKITFGIIAVTGLDNFLAKGFAWLFLALLLGTPLGGFFWSFLPFPQKNKRRKRFIFLIIFAVILFASFFTSSNVYFHPLTGEPVKYYTVTTDQEYAFYSSPGYDPITGKKLKPVIKEVVVRYLQGDVAIDFADSVQIKKEQTESVRTVVFKNKLKQDVAVFIKRDTTQFYNPLRLRIPKKQQASIELPRGENLMCFVINDSVMADFKYGGELFYRTGFRHELQTMTFRLEGDKRLAVNETFIMKIGKGKNHKITIDKKEIAYNKDDKLVFFLSLAFFLGGLILILIFSFIFLHLETIRKRKEDKKRAKQYDKERRLERERILKR